MARGDTWRWSAGIYIPNARFQIDTDFLPTSAQWIPDGWEINAGGVGGLSLRYANGFSDHRAWRIDSIPSGGGTNQLISAATPAGSVPVMQTNAENIALRLVFWYKKTTSNQTLTPILRVYNAAETSQFDVSFTGFSASQASWTKYDNVQAVDLSVATRGFTVDHAKLILQLGGSASQTVFIVDDITLGYPLTDQALAAGYNTTTMPPILAGLGLNSIELATIQRTPFGQARLVDRTGGAQLHRINVEWSANGVADRRVIDLAWRHCRGLGSKPALGTAIVRPPCNPGPVVVEPFYFDGATQSEGQQPENLYMWMMSEPNFTPVGYLGNAYRGSMVLEEVG